MTNAQLQQALAAEGYPLLIDGVLGPRTTAAIKDFQLKQNLLVDGVAGPRTLAALMGTKPRWALTQQALISAAKSLKVPVAAVQAVAEVESAGAGFIADGLPTILFERHVFFKRLKLHGFDAMLVSRQHPDIASSIPGGYKGGMSEHERLARAAAIHPVAAIESASFGRFQIMGYHWARLGYASAPAFNAAMSTSESHQLEAFSAFIKSDPALHQALKSQHWANFARLYNGPEYAKNRYDQKLSAAFKRLGGVSLQGSRA